ncbi:MAG: hypothetical protein ACLFTT_03630 [Candidatus Hydrogenedentota bacterium]
MNITGAGNPQVVSRVCGWTGAVVLVCAMAAAGAAAEAVRDAAGEPVQLRLQGDGRNAPVIPEESEETIAREWFFFLAGVNVYPRLKSEGLIDDLFEPAIRLIAPGFGDVRTFGDVRDNGLMWPPHVGIGRVLSPEFAIFIQGGYSIGTVRTQSVNRSIFLLDLETDFKIRRGAAYFGFGVDYYPWGMPELKKYETWKDRIRAARPALGGRFTATYALYEAKVDLHLRPLPNIPIRLDDGWLTPSFNVNIGLDVPVSEKNALFGNAGYAFFLDRADDFAGWAFTIGWKHFFCWDQ